MEGYSRAITFVPIPFIVFFLSLIIIGRFNFFSVLFGILLAISSLLTLFQYNNYWTFVLVALPSGFLMGQYTIGAKLFTPIEELNTFRWIILLIYFGIVLGFMWVTRKETTYEKVIIDK